MRHPNETISPRRSNNSAFQSNDGPDYLKMSATQHQKALVQANNVESQLQGKFGKTGIKSRSPD